MRKHVQKFANIMPAASNKRGYGAVCLAQGNGETATPATTYLG